MRSGMGSVLGWGTRTEEELLPGREHVHAEGHLELVLLEGQPLSKRSEERHAGEVSRISLYYSIAGVAIKSEIRRRRVVETSE